MDAKVSPCGCRMVLPRVYGAPAFQIQCPHHGAGPMALELVKRITETPAVMRALETAEQVLGEVPGSTLARQLTLVALGAEELEKRAAMSSVTFDRLKYAELVPKWAVTAEAES